MWPGGGGPNPPKFSPSRRCSPTGPRGTVLALADAPPADGPPPLPRTFPDVFPASAMRSGALQEITVVLAVEDPPLQEEILHFLDRIPRMRVLGAAATAEELARRVRERRPQVAVVTPGVLGEAGDLDSATLLVVGTEERTGDLRVAIRAGARGFYLWPEERDALGRDAIRAAPPGKTDERPPGKAVAVYGPRGGAGATFLATNLAAACAREGAETVLVDVDLFFADATVAVGLGAEDPPRTLAD